MATPERTIRSTVIEVARRTVLQMNARRFLVFIDDAPVGTLWAFQTGRYFVQPGRHQVRLSISGSMAESNVVNVDVPPGSVRRLRTRGRNLANSLKWPVTMMNAAQGKAGDQSGQPAIVLTPDEETRR